MCGLFPPELASGGFKHKILGIGQSKTTRPTQMCNININKK